MALLRRFLNVFRPARLDRELNEELEFHREMRLRRSRERGLSAAEAEDETRRRMGNLLLAKEEMRDARMVQWLASSLQDLRHGLVLLRRDPGVSALIVLVLALGIGGNAAVFTLLKAAFLDPLPYRDAGRLVTVIENDGWIPTVSEFLEIRNAHPHARRDGVCRAPRHATQWDGRAHAGFRRARDGLLLSAAGSECGAGQNVSRGRESAGPAAGSNPQ